jgi:hypothetical protein
MARRGLNDRQLHAPNLPPAFELQVRDLRAGDQLPADDVLAFAEDALAIVADGHVELDLQPTYRGTSD